MTMQIGIIKPIQLYTQSEYIYVYYWHTCISNLYQMHFQM